MDRLAVFPLTQPYITDMWERDTLERIAIQRIQPHDWLPLFHVVADDGSRRICALKTMDSGNLRTWYQLDVLAEWIRTEFETYTVEVSLSDVELVNKEETNVP